jgi:hypothetical protein
LHDERGLAMQTAVFPYITEPLERGSYVIAGRAGATWRVDSCSEASGPDDRRELVLWPISPHSIPLTAHVAELANPVVVEPGPVPAPLA